jgi:hypothetical protein
MHHVLVSVWSTDPLQLQRMKNMVYEIINGNQISWAGGIQEFLALGDGPNPIDLTTTPPIISHQVQVRLIYQDVSGGTG